MTPDALKQLEAAFRQSPKEADRLLDEMLVGDLQKRHVTLKSSGARSNRAYLVPRPETDITVSAQTEAEHLIQAAGLASAIWQLDEQQAGVSTASAVPAPPDGTYDCDPTLQAQACLLVLERNSEASKQHWSSVELARDRLARLILDFPMLMHPRLLFDFESIRTVGRMNEPVPLVHAILQNGLASLPCPFMGFGPQELRQFALHPVVPYALRTRAPITAFSYSSVNGTSNRLLQGKTVATLLLESRAPRYLMAQALLHIDRLRQEAGAGAPLFNGTDNGRSGVENLIRQTFKAIWTRHDGAIKSAPGFLDELRASPTHPGLNYRAQLLRDSTLLIASPSAGWSGGTKPTVNVNPDPTGSFARLKSCLLSAGAFEAGQDVSRAVVEALFPHRSQGGQMSTAIVAATVDGAFSLLQRFRDDGVEVDELALRIRNYYRDSTFDQAVTVLETEAMMTAAIDLAGASASTQEPGQSTDSARRTRRPGL